MAALADSGSGPSLRPSGSRRWLTYVTVTPGWHQTAAPSSRTSTPFQAERRSAMMPVPSVWPQSEVPAARNVTGIRRARARASTRWTSATDDTRATASGRYS